MKAFASKQAALARSTLHVVALTAAVASATPASAQSYEDPWHIDYPHIELGFDAGAVIWNAVDRNIVRPGGFVDFRLGWDYKWWVPMFALGFRGSGLDLFNVPGAPPGTRSDTLSNIYFSLGARFKAPNSSRVTPFADGFFDFNWWYVSQFVGSCAEFYCNGGRGYRFTPGFHGRLGIQIHVAPRADLELGFGAGYSFRGQFFFRNRSWLEPTIAFTYNFPAGYENRTSIPGYE